MVDIGDKDTTARLARAQAIVRMQPETLAMISEGGHQKGDVLTIAKIAGIQAAKSCSNLIPLCHSLSLTSVDISFTLDIDKSLLRVESCCQLQGKTGVEMEALTAAAISALTIYDMCKAVDKRMCIDKIFLLEKRGGRSGHFVADAAKSP